MGWINDVETFRQVMEYERFVQNGFTGKPSLVALCQYRVNECTDEMIKDILKTHTHTFYDNGDSVSLFNSEELLQSDTVRFLHESIRDKARLDKNCRHLTVANGLTSRTLYRKGPKYTAEKAIEYLAGEQNAQIALSLYIDKETNRLLYTSCFGIDLDTVVAQIAGPTIKCLRDYANSIHPYITEDMETVPLQELWDRHQIKSIAIIPLKNGRSIMGLTFIGWANVVNSNLADLDVIGYFLNTVNLALDIHHLQEKTFKKKKDAEKLEALGTLISGIAHEFNNILAVILGNCQLLELKCQDEGLGKLISDASRAAHDAVNIVRRIQNYSRPEVTYEKTNIRIDSLITSAIEFTRPKWLNESVAAGIEVIVDARLNSSQVVYGNEGELREVFINLILNAVDALPDGGRITLTTEDLGSQVIVTVADDGVGMSIEEVEKAFDPFFTTKYERGTGLGLTITKNMILAHNEEISVDSEKGKGTIFTIKLPAGPQPGSLEVKEVSLRGKCLKINVVDDDEQVLNSICNQLISLGHRVSAFTNAAEMLARIDQEGDADLIITDLAMPGINGIDLAKMIKEKHAGLPVILMTGWFDGTRDFLERDAIAGILYKPFSLYDLQKQIAEIRGLVS